MTYRKKVIWLIVCYLILVLIYRLGNQDWLFIPGLIIGAVSLSYLLSIRCPSCGRGQVIRGLFLGVGLPNKNCYYCKAALEKTNQSKQSKGSDTFLRTPVKKSISCGVKP